MNPFQNISNSIAGLKLEPYNSFWRDVSDRDARCVKEHKRQIYCVFFVCKNFTKRLNVAHAAPWCFCFSKILNT